MPCAYLSGTLTSHLIMTYWNFLAGCLIPVVLAIWIFRASKDIVPCQSLGRGCPHLVFRRLLSKLLPVPLWLAVRHPFLLNTWSAHTQSIWKKTSTIWTQVCLFILFNSCSSRRTVETILSKSTCTHPVAVFRDIGIAPVKYFCIHYNHDFCNNSCPLSPRCWSPYTGWVGRHKVKRSIIDLT